MIGEDGEENETQLIAVPVSGSRTSAGGGTSWVKATSKEPKGGTEKKGEPQKEGDRESEKEGESRKEGDPEAVGPWTSAVLEEMAEEREVDNEGGPSR